MRSDEIRRKAQEERGGCMALVWDGPFSAYCSRKAKRNGLCRQHWKRRHPDTPWEEGAAKESAR